MTPVLIAKVARTTLHSEVTSRLRNLIVQGHFAPGERINEVRLGEDLGVSRTPLREAIRTLSSEGLLELIPNRGAIVRAFSLHEVLDMLEALAVIEQGCGELACERATEADLELFQARQEAMVQSYEARDRLLYFQINQELHGMIVSLADNAALGGVHAEIQAKLKRIRFLGNDEPSVWARAVAEHVRIAEALMHRDSRDLVAVLRSHNELTLGRVRSATVGEVV
jgi:DNA-binding GntR family transcriptional regulator